MMERPNIGILLSPDCFLWTEHGLLTPKEMNPGDNLLGLDSKSNLVKFPLSEKPVDCGDTQVVSINTKCNETILGADTSVFTNSGIIKAKDVEKGIVLEMLTETKCNEIKKICIPKENQTKIFGITINPDIALCLAIARPHTSPRVIFSSIINKYPIPELNDILTKILPQLRREIGGRLFNKVMDGKSSWFFDHDKFYQVCQKINFQQGRLNWYKGWATQESTLEIPKFLRDNGLALMGNFFSGIIAFRCRVSQNTKFVSIQTPEKLHVVRAFIQNLAWIFGLNVYRKWIKSNGNYALEFKIDDFDGNIHRNADYAPVLHAIPEQSKTYCIQIPTNCTTWVDNVPVRANKINYEN